MNGEGECGVSSDIYSIGLLIRLIFGGNEYKRISSKCSQIIPTKRYQSIDEVKKAISRRNVLPVLVSIVAFAIIVVGLSLTPIAQKAVNKEKIYNLEEQYENELKERFNATVQLMQKQRYQEFAVQISQEYLDYYVHFIDSLEKIYPMRNAGETAPEIIAITEIFPRQQAQTDSIIMSLPSITTLPDSEQGALIDMLNSGIIPE